MAEPTAPLYAYGHFSPRFRRIDVTGKRFAFARLV
jgi:hypothetical protein